MKSNFTPGPWTTKKIDTGTYDVCRCGNDGLRTRVCRLHASQIEPEHGGTIEANAKLIAAAPDLLAALERLAHPMADDDDLDYARAIIAKAKGLQ
jgi:hypothetical protein